MSNKERAIDIINQIPEYNLIYVINMLNGIKDLLMNDGEEVEPDEFDLKMISDAESENDGNLVSFEELLKQDGLNVDEI